MDSNNKNTCINCIYCKYSCSWCSIKGFQITPKRPKCMHYVERMSKNKYIDRNGYLKKDDIDNEKKNNIS